MLSKVPKILYQMVQTSKSIGSLTHKEVSTRLMTLFAPEGAPITNDVPSTMLKDLQDSMEDLIQEDWHDTEIGIYPVSLLFDISWAHWIKYYPLVCLDIPITWNRRLRRNINDLPKSLNKNIYPSYFLQNFHHQTDGYLSDHSAKIYDLQVEILFNGTADAMRRRILAPLVNGLRHFKSQSPWQIKILDIATGTGRVLHQINSTIPNTQLIGLDLSASYLRQAKHYFIENGNDLPQFIQANAEKLPLQNNSIEGVSCVFLLHELPGEARQNVLNECFRILKPGGILVLADSIQLADSPQFSIVIENFKRIFHEPYYYDYINDDIVLRLHLAGFSEIRVKSHFMTRVWSAIKLK